MKTAFYTNIDLYDGVTEDDVIRRSHTLGSELIKFDGWTDDDLGPSGMPGPRRMAAAENRNRLSKISDTFTREYPDGTYDCIVINQTRDD